MKITLIAPTYLPARRANTIQVMKMAQAFAVLGHNVLVLVPGKGSSAPTWVELARHYGLQHHFDIEWLSAWPCLRRYDYGLAAVHRARSWGAELIYTRLPQAAVLASVLGCSTIYEIHDLPQGMLGPWLLRRFLTGRGARALVVITAALKEALTSRFSPPAGLPLVIAPDAVDLARYQNLPSLAEARQSLNSAFRIPNSPFIAGYTGHFYPGRGSELILQMASQLPDVGFLLVGGDPADVERLRGEVEFRRLDNITLTGFVSNAELPLYQAACNLLLMPYQRNVSASSGGDIARYLSPMKLFEYLACGRPILSSDLPVLREVLNPKNAVLLPPDEIEAWVAAIREVRHNPAQCAAMAAQAQQDVQQYSWEARAARILAASEVSSLNSNG
jgi:glycosyltransferase involved in cell wall biosynthesis